MPESLAVVWDNCIYCLLRDKTKLKNGQELEITKSEKNF